MSTTIVLGPAAPSPGLPVVAAGRTPGAHADRAAGIAFRPGAAADAPAVLRLIEDNMEVGHLLPRTIEDLVAHAHRFVIAVDGAAVVGCAELAPLSLAVAEVRSLVVAESWRGVGLGTRLISTLQRQARVAGFATLCAFTHEPAPFVRLGFSIVPHVWFPEKIAVDCTACPKFRTCGQHAMALALDGVALQPPAGSYRRMPITAVSHASVRAGEVASLSGVRR
jgi:amino-acid N-acetyltransferase